MPAAQPRSLRDKLLRAREQGDRLWTMYSTAARITIQREEGRPWDEIDEVMALSRDGDRVEAQADWERLLGQDADLVAAAREILEEDELD